MDWGLLAGLGEAAKGFGHAWSDRAKSDLAERLAKEREERAEQRAIAREERQRKQLQGTPKEFRVERDTDGVTWRVPYNAMGERLGERELASAEDIKNYNFNDQKDKLTLEKLVADTQRTREKHEADMKYKEAATDAQRARAARTRALPLDGSGRTSSSSEPSESDYVAELDKQSKKLLDGYDISSTQRAKLLQDAVQQSARYGLHPMDVLNEMLFERQVKKKGSSKSNSTPGQVDLR